MKALKTIAALIILLLSAVLASHCVDEPNRESSEHGVAFKSPLPPSLVMSQGILGLQAELIIDGKKTYPLIVDANDYCSGRITNVPIGDHNLTLRYFVLYPPPAGTTKLILAEQTIKVTVVKDMEVEASFSKFDFAYPDLDGDGFTNLEEYNRGYDPTTYCQDADLDNYQSKTCGGDDCDDSDPLSRPGVSPYGSPQRMTNTGGSSASPSMVYTGSEFGVSYQDSRDGDSEIYFTRISVGGQKIGFDQRISADTGYSMSPRLVWTGSEYGLIWGDNKNLSQAYTEPYFIRITMEGSIIGAELRVSTPQLDHTSISFSIAWTGSEYGLSWCDVSDIWFARIASTGVKIGSELRVSSTPSQRLSTSLAWTGSEFGVSWSDWLYGQYEIFFTRISAAGEKNGPDLQLTDDPGYNTLNPSMVWTGSEFAVAFHDDRDGNAEIYYAHAAPSGARIGSDVRITYDASTSVVPSLSWTGLELGLSWMDNRTGFYEIYFSLIDTSGTKIVSDLRITDDNYNDASASTLAWDGSEFGVTWSHNQVYPDSDIYFQRIFYSCP